MKGKVFLIAVLAALCGLLWHFSPKSAADVSVSYQNADGTYPSPTALKVDGKTVTTPASKYYASKTVKCTPGRKTVIKVPRRRVSIHISGERLKWRLTVNGKDSTGMNVIMGAPYNIYRITPDDGYVYSGASGGSTSGTAKNLNIRLESIKKHYRTVLSFSNGEALLLSLTKGEKISLADKIKIPDECTLDSIKEGKHSYELEDIFTQPGRNVQIDVVFKEIWYTVKYKNAYSNPNPAKYQKSLTLKTPVRNGYEFIGWKLGKKFITSLNHQNAELTAVWEKTHTVTFDGEDAEGYMNPMTGTSITLPDSSFTKEGCTFTEWNTKADGTGDSYKPGDAVKSDLTLYPQWKKNKSASANDQNNNSADDQNDNASSDSNASDNASSNSSESAKKTKNDKQAKNSKTDITDSNSQTDTTETGKNDALSGNTD